MHPLLDERLDAAQARRRLSRMVSELPQMDTEVESRDTYHEELQHVRQTRRIVLVHHLARFSATTFAADMSTQAHQDRERSIPATLELRFRVEPSRILALETRVPDLEDGACGDAVMGFALSARAHVSDEF